MEEYSEMIKYPCNNKIDGCTDMITRSEKKAHEDSCEFRVFECPCWDLDCEWSGTIKNTIGHILSRHSSVFTLHSDEGVLEATDFFLNRRTDWIMGQVCYGEHFLLVVSKYRRIGSYNQMFIAVRIIAKRERALNFQYQLGIGNPDHRITYEATPISMGEQLNETNSFVLESMYSYDFAPEEHMEFKIKISPA